MTSKRLNAEVLVYKKLLANGDIQATYQALVGIVQHLRTYFKKKYKDNFSQVEYIKKIVINIIPTFLENLVE